MDSGGSQAQVEGEVKGEVKDDHSQWGKAGGNGDTGSKELEEWGKSLANAQRRVEELADKWKHWVSQARQIAKSQGVGMGSLESEIDELLEPKLPWRELLRNFILASTKSNYRICPPNRRHIWRGLYLPSIYGEDIEVGFAIDTSGSMSDEDIKEGLSEVKSICEQFESYTVHLFQCDYGIQEYRELTAYDFDFPDKIKGRGGTSFVPVFEDIAERNITLACLVYVTDGYGTFPEIPPEYPVIWLTHSKDVEFPFGEVIYLDNA
jgi:predicted metal-dependent peptidase